jgi:hypothetical protein
MDVESMNMEGQLQSQQDGLMDKDVKCEKEKNQGKCQGF